MKPRKIMVTIEALSNVPIKEFNKLNIQEMFDTDFIEAYTKNKDIEIFTVHQVKAQVVKPEK